MSDFIERFYQDCRRVVEPSPTPDLHAPTRWKVRRWRGIRRSWMAAAATTLALAGGGALAAATLTPSSSPPDAGAPPAITTEPALTTVFGVLRRPTTTSDAIPTRYPVVFSGASGANIQLAHKANELPGAVAWVIPGRGNVCLMANSTTSNLGGAGCQPVSSAAASKLKIESTDIATPGINFVAGLVPDGIRMVTLRMHSGLSLTVPVHDNVYAVSLHGSVASILLEH